MRAFGICVCGLLLSFFYANSWAQDPLPILQLYDFVDDPENIIKNSDCKDGLVNDMDYLTVRGKVNKNGSSGDAYTDTNLYLQAVRDVSTNAWASQCRPDLSICASNLSTDCFCERKDPNGDYHIVMTIMVKKNYHGGSLMLSWNDRRSPYNPPIVSNIVTYYSRTISEAMTVTCTIGTQEINLDNEIRMNEYKDFTLPYTPDMTNITFCVDNLEPQSKIKIEEEEMTEELTTDGISEPCVTLDLTSETEMLTMSFNETKGCKRTGSYILRLETVSPDTPCCEGWEIAVIVIFSLLGLVIISIIAVCLKKKQKKKGRSPFPENLETGSPPKKGDLEPSELSFGKHTRLPPISSASSPERETPEKKPKKRKGANTGPGGTHDEKLSTKSMSNEENNTEKSLKKNSSKEDEDGSPGVQNGGVETMALTAKVNSTTKKKKKKKRTKTEQKGADNEVEVNEDELDAQDGSPGEQKGRAVFPRPLPKLGEGKVKPVDPIIPSSQRELPKPSNLSPIRGTPGYVLDSGDSVNTSKSNPHSITTHFANRMSPSKGPRPTSVEVTRGNQSTNF